MLFLSSHNNFNLNGLLGCVIRNNGSFYLSTVNDELLNALLNAVLLDGDVIFDTSVDPLDAEIAEIRRYTGINGKSLKSGIYSEDVL